MSEVLLEARGIGKRFGGVQALKEVSLTIRTKEIYGLIGPNGAGKTTFFNVLTGLYARDSGDVLFDGQALELGSPHYVAQAGIARTFQNIRLFGNMTAMENVMVGRHVRTHAGVFGAILRTPFQRREEAAIRRRAEELLHYVGIAHRAGDLARHLSYGDQRRLEIARGLLHCPKILFLDEPTLGLDPQTRVHIWEYILKMRKESNLTVFMTTHYMQEAEVCDRIAIIDHGKIVDLDSPANLKSKHQELTLEGVFLKVTGKEIREQAGESSWVQWMRRT